MAEDFDDLRSALSARFGADAADAFSEEFLDLIVSEQSAAVRGLAKEWGWSDTEVRDQVCLTAERLLVEGHGDCDV